MSEGFNRAARSLAARLVLVACAFVAVPVILYGEFSAAENAKRDVLLARLQVEGQLIASGLRLDWRG
jgi:two-component system sensor histidine kinase ChvG